jgi:hypothetical protein
VSASRAAAARPGLLLVPSVAVLLLLVAGANVAGALLLNIEHSILRTSSRCSHRFCFPGMASDVEERAGDFWNDGILGCGGARRPAPTFHRQPVDVVAASMLTAAYFMLRDGVEYVDLGGTYFVHRDVEQTKQRLLRRLRDLGVVVEVKAA